MAKAKVDIAHLAGTWSPFAKPSLEVVPTGMQ